jgi:hypothetical protein
MKATTVNGKGSSRIKRPQLARSHPRRAFSGIFGAPGVPSRSSANGVAQKSKQSPVVATEAVARGVNAGYSVIEEYVRQGQDLARSLWPNPTEETARTRSLNMTDRMIRSASDLVGLFSEFLQTFTLPGTLPAPGSQPIPDFGIAPSERPIATPEPIVSATSAAAGTAPSETDPNGRVSVDVESNRRTEVTVDLKPRSWGSKLAVHDLRSTKASAPCLTGIKARAFPSEQRIVIRVRIPDRHPAGTYHGLIVDRGANLPRGAITVRILDDNRRRQ